MLSDDMQPGEIQRTLIRIESRIAELSRDVAQVIGPVSSLEIRMASAERNLERLDGEVAAATTQAAKISGAGAVLAVLAALIPWPWKH